MAGMYGLGRQYNKVPTAAGQPVSFKTASGIAFCCVGADTYTVTIGATFGGSFAAPPTAGSGGIIQRYWTSSSATGTAAWTEVDLAYGSYLNAITIASGIVVIEILTSQMLIPDAYVKVTPSASGLVIADAFDLTVKRAPANLAPLAA